VHDSVRDAGDGEGTIRDFFGMRLAEERGMVGVLRHSWRPVETLFERASWLFKVGGVGLCAALAASIVSTSVGAWLPAAPAPAADEGGAEETPEVYELTSATVQTRERARVDRTTTLAEMVRRNPFCPTCSKAELGGAAAQPSGESGGAAVTELSGARPCTLPLRLVATMEAGLTAWATIRDAEDGSVGPFGPTEFIRPGVSLVSIERGRVYLRHQNVLEVLELGAEPPPPPPKQVAKPTPADKPPAKESLPGMAEGVRCDSANACTISREFVDSLFGNPAKLMGQARVAPATRDGETRGFEFRGVKRDSLPQVLGIANGDIVTSVNGNSLQSIDQVMGLVTKLRRASNLSITLERKGATVTKEIEIR
jgi:hypothetical protein